MRISDWSSDVCSSDLVKDDWENRTLKMVVRVDQTRASRAGITSADIAASLNAALSGTQISTFRETEQAIPIVLRGAKSDQLTIDRLRSLTVFSADGSHAVPLLEVAEFAGIPEDAVIHRRNQVRTRSEEHTSELQSLMRISYAVLCLNITTPTQI